MAVYNPRFPFTFKVLRARMDENGEPVFDADALPVYDELSFPIVQYDGFLPRRDSDGWVTETGSVFPYGYRQQTANAVVNGDVIINEMKIGCPIIIGEIRTKDLLELTDSDRTFYAEVTKKIDTNFGTNIWYHEVKQ